MILNKLYTIPNPLFTPIEFRTGLNIIYAHKDNPNDPKSSPHSVGKSSVLDLILFALLFDFSEKSSRRLYNAYKKKILHGSSVVLEFTVNSIPYIITRSFDNPNNKIYFGPLSKSRLSYTIGKLREQLYELIFNRPDYPGEAKSFWYQKLFSFFIKVKKREELFSDPIEFSRNFNELELTPFHLFLLDIDNTLPFRHIDLLESIQKTESLIKESEKLLRDISQTKDLMTLENKRAKLSNDIKKLENRVASFTLADNYSEYEKRADELTSEIKDLWFKNTIDRKKLEDLKEFEKSLPTEVYENLSNINNLYNEVNSLLAGNIKKSLQDAMSFRKSLHSSRSEFVKTEKGRLTNSIFSRTQLIAKLEAERNKILNDLSSQKALDDLTSTYQHLSKLQYEFAEIENSLKSIDKLKAALKAKRDEHSALLSGINDYLKLIDSDVIKFRELLSSVFNTLFLDQHKVDVFNVNETDGREKIKISLLEGSIMDSSAMNQIRTLAYDLSVLNNIVDNGLKAPHFIAHDGIFEVLHESHLIVFLSLIDQLIKNNFNFQYILTLNERDFLSQPPDFKQNKIISNSVIQLSKSKLLFNSEF